MFPGSESQQRQHEKAVSLNGFFLQRSLKAVSGCWRPTRPLHDDRVLM